MSDADAVGDWRAALATPAAERAYDIVRRHFAPVGKSPTNDELNFSLGWFAEVGIPALRAATAEAEEMGVSIYALQARAALEPQP